VKKSVFIIGGGPAALLCAAFLDEKKFDVTIYDQKKAFGRKFLVAGKGGFNLTHSEPIEDFVNRYTPKDFLKEALFNFTNSDFRVWLESIGIPTMVGSSKRVYPEGDIKPIEVLDTILTHLKNKGVQFCFEHKWTGWSANGNIIFNNQDELRSDFTVFALGGASWAKTGSNGAWLEAFKKNSIEVVDFDASNCAFHVNWPDEFIQHHEGIPLKNIAVSCNGKIQKGEAVITASGMEGNAVYALSPEVRSEISKGGSAAIYVDLKPTMTEESIVVKLANSNSKKVSEVLKKDLNMNRAQISLLKSHVAKADFLNKHNLAKSIKSLKLQVTRMGSVEESISTVGGVALSAVDSSLGLAQIENTYCIGEMLNWDAPTGGYLIQACVSMGVCVARDLNELINSV